MIESIIQFSELEDRLDADYYNPKYLKLMKELDKFPKVKTLDDIIGEMKYGVYIEANYKEEGIPFIRSKNLGKYWIGGEILNVSDSLKSEIENYRLKKNDILIARTGTVTTVGNTGIITQDFVDATFGSYIILLRPKTEDILPKFLLIFLKCKYGKKQSERLARGIRQKNINEPLLKSIKVPIPSLSLQEEIQDLFDKFLKVKRKAERLLKETENRLLDILDISFSFKEEQNYKTSFSRFKESQRLDAEYYKPKYTKLEEAIGNSPYEFKPIKSFCDEIGKGFEPGSDKYVEKGYPFIRVRNVDKFNINEENLVYLGEDTYQENKKHSPKKGDVLFTKDGRVGSSAVIEEDKGKMLLSGGIVKFTLKKKIDPYFISLYLNSSIVKLIAERKTIGSTIPHFGYRKSKKLRVPDVPLEIQKELGQITREYIKLNKESKDLIGKAKSKVEKVIEKEN